MEDRKLSLNPSGQTCEKVKLYLVIFALKLFIFTFVLCLFRYKRDFVVEGEPYAGYDRHNAEVAAFHLDRYVDIMDTVVSLLDISAGTNLCFVFVCVFNALFRILGFRRAPLVVGRYINLRTEIKPVATDQLLGTFLMQGEYVHQNIT